MMVLQPYCGRCYGVGLPMDSHEIELGALRPTCVRCGSDSWLAYVEVLPACEGCGSMDEASWVRSGEVAEWLADN